MSRTPAGVLLAVALTALGLVWLALIAAAPLAVAHGGAVWPAFVYQAAGLVCHQRPDRSFHLAGLQLPVCARCFGLYASGAAGAGAAWLTGAALLTRRLEASPRVPLALAAAPTALTVAGEWLGLVQPGNVGRATAAIPLGLFAGWLFVTLLRAPAAAGRPGQMRYHA